MTKEEFEGCVNHLRKMNDLGIISDSTYQSLTQEAFEKVKAEQRRDVYFGYHLTENAISYKKKFDTSYWATVPPETSQDAPQISFTAESYDPTEIFPKPSNGLIWRGKIGKGVLDNRRGLNERN